MTNEEYVYKLITDLNTTKECNNPKSPDFWINKIHDTNNKDITLELMHDKNTLLKTTLSYNDYTRGLKEMSYEGFASALFNSILKGNIVKGICSGNTVNIINSVKDFPEMPSATKEEVKDILNKSLSIYE